MPPIASTYPHVAPSRSPQDSDARTLLERLAAYSEDMSPEELTASLASLYQTGTALGESQARWAMSPGLPVSRIYHAEYGGGAPQAIIEALTAAGYDGQALARAYLSWRRGQTVSVQVAR